MATTTQRDEWKALSDILAIGAAAFLVILGLVLAIAGGDPVMKFHGCLLLGASGLALLYILTQIVEGRAPADPSGYADGVIRAGVIATVFWGIAGFIVGDVIAWQLAFPALNFTPFFAGMRIASLVRGSRPMRAARCDTEKVPKPTKVTLRP